MKTGKNEITRAERTGQILDLRKQGKSYRWIGRALGISGARVHKIVTTELDRLNAKSSESMDQIRRMELERIDDLWAESRSLAQSGDVAAINACIRIMERRARLLGLDAQPAGPETMEITLRVPAMEQWQLPKQETNPCIDVTPPVNQDQLQDESDSELSSE